MLTRTQIDALLAEYAKQLLKAPRQRIRLDRLWVRDFLAAPGIYGIFQGDTLIYAGESGSLRKRMGDLLNTTNHNFRRQIGKQLFSEREGFVCASSKRKFDPPLEVELCAWIQKNAMVALLPIDFGRKEIEEYLVDRYKPKCNSKCRRQ